MSIFCTRVERSLALQAFAKLKVFFDYNYSQGSALNRRFTRTRPNNFQKLRRIETHCLNGCDSKIAVARSFLGIGCMPNRYIVAEFCVSISVDVTRTRKISLLSKRCLNYVMKTWFMHDINIQWLGFLRVRFLLWFPRCGQCGWTKHNS